MRFHLLFAAIIAMFSTCVIAGTNPSPTATVAPAVKSPKVDGIISSGEYDGCARLGSFAIFPTNQIAKDQSEVYVTYDDSNFYIAFRFYFTSGVPKATCVGVDGKLWEDDAVELFIQPDTTQWKYVQFMGNPTGAYLDQYSAGENQKDFNWNAPWNYKAHVTAGYWEGEVSIPYSALNTSKPAVGAMWGFNACRDQQLLPAVLSSWSIIRDYGFNNPISFGKLTFAPQSAITQFNLNSNKETRKIELTGNIVNNSESGKHITGYLETTREGSEAKRTEIDLNAGPGQTKAVSIQEVLDFGDYTIFYVLKDTDAIITSQTSYLSLPSPLVVHKYFFHDKIGLSLPADKLVGATSIRYIVLKNGDPVITVPHNLKPKSGEETLLDISKLSADKYSVTASVMKGAKLLFSANGEFEKPAKPEWWDSKIGISDKVLAPWTPLKRDNLMISCWGRTYVFDGMPVPSRIYSRGVKLLGQPVTLNASVNGKTVKWKSGAPKVTEETPARIVLKSTAKFGTITLNGSTTLEYDGFVRIDMSIKGRKTDTMDKLVMDIPMDKKTAELFFASTTESYLSPIWPYWKGGKNGLVKDKIITGPFSPSVWLGNNMQGLWWFTEGAKNWANKDDQRVISIVPQGNNVILRVAFVDYPIPLNKTLDLTFGLQATPVKTPAKPKKIWRGHLDYGTEQNVSIRSSNVGMLKYPAKGNINPDKGSVHIWTTIDFDPNVQVEPNIPRGMYNQSLFSLEFPNKNALGLYWNIDVRGMVSLVSQNGTYPVLNNFKADFKKGDKHLITLSWGDEVSVFVDGKLCSSMPYKGSLLDDIKDGIINLSGGFGISAIKITNLPYDGVSKITLAVDEHTLLYDTFSDMGDNTTTIAEKCSGASGGKLEGKYMATPRLIRFSSDSRPVTVFDDWKDQGFDIIHFHEHWTETEGYPKTVKHAAELKPIVDAVKRAGMRMMLYIGFQLGDNSPEWKLYKDEVRTEPWVEGQGWKREDHIGYGVSYAGRYSNFMLYNMRKLITDYGVNAFYFDGTIYPPADTNKWHGAGYIDRKGKLQPTWQVFAYRDFLKRVRTMASELDPTFWIDMHVSGGIFTPTASFGDTTLSGEQYAPLGEAVGRSLSAVVDPDDFRAEEVGTQYGFPLTFLAYFDYQSADALAFTHGNIPANEVSKKLGIDLSTAKWSPYWENSKTIKTPASTIRVSYYQTQKDGLILVATNYSKAAVDADITLDLTALGLSSNVTAHDVLSSEMMVSSGGVLKLHLEPWLVRFISVK